MNDPDPGAVMVARVQTLSVALMLLESSGLFAPDIRTVTSTADELWHWVTFTHTSRGENY